MGLFDGLFNSQKNTINAYGQSLNDLDATRSLTDPYYENLVGGGTSSLTRLQDLLNLNGRDAADKALASFQTSPGYQFAVDQGRDAIDQSAIARGNLNSGATLKALTDYGQGMANQEYQTYLGNLSGMASGGLNGASGLLNTSNMYGNLAIGQGQARDTQNQASAGNVLGIAGTLMGYAGGAPSSNSGLGRMYFPPAPSGAGLAEGYVSDPWARMR